MEEIKVIVDRTASAFVITLEATEGLIPLLYQEISKRNDHIDSVALSGMESIEDLNELSLQSLIDSVWKMVLFSTDLSVDSEFDNLDWFLKTIVQLSWCSWKVLMTIHSKQDYDLRKENLLSETLIDCFQSIILLQSLVQLFKRGMELLCACSNHKKPVSALFRDPKFLGEILALHYLFRSFLETFTIEEWVILHQISIHEQNVLIRRKATEAVVVDLIPKTTNQPEFPHFFHFQSISNENFTKNQFNHAHQFKNALFTENSFLFDAQSTLTETMINDDLPRIFGDWQNHLLTIAKQYSNLMPTLLQDIFTYSHIELAKCWNNLPHHFESDQLFTKAYLLSFTLISDRSVTDFQFLKPSSLQIQSSGMVGMIAIIMRLFDRYDTQSYLLATHFLGQSCQYITASQLLPLLEWIIEKVSMMFNLIDDHFTRFYLSRVFQSMVMISNDSNLLTHHAYLFLDSTIKNICKEYDPVKVWFRMLTLQFCFVFYPTVMIRCYLTKLRVVTSHCLHLWHLPLQKLTILQLEYFLGTFSSELTPFVTIFLGDLFSAYIFYSKKTIPDISMAPPEEVSSFREWILSVKKKIADQYPRLFSNWCTSLKDLTSPSVTELSTEKMNIVEQLLTDKNPIPSLIELREFYAIFTANK